MKSGCFLAKIMQGLAKNVVKILLIWYADLFSQIQRRAVSGRFCIVPQKTDISAKGSTQGESGEIGRRTRLRIWRRKVSGFESPLSHHLSDEYDVIF